MNDRAQRYYRTLCRIPPEIRLSMATREFYMHDGNHCVCGWAIREQLLAATGRAGMPPKNKEHEALAASMFGGDMEDWADIYFGVLDSQVRDIELAFTMAVDDACTRMMTP